jgi:hypothetical protein
MLDALAILLVAAVFASIGALLCWANLSGMQVEARDRASSLQTDGVVVEIRDSEAALLDGGPYKSPVVRFRTATGQQVQFVSTEATNPTRYTVGQSVRVLYHGDDPARADIVGAHTLTRVALLLLGGAFVSAGVLLLALAGLRAWRALW